MPRPTFGSARPLFKIASSWDKRYGKDARTKIMQYGRGRNKHDKQLLGDVADAADMIRRTDEWFEREERRRRSIERD